MMARKSRKATEMAILAQPEQLIYNAGAYIRLSSDARRKPDDSLENQQDIIENFIASSPDIRLVEIYCDNQTTGTNFDRSDFNRMLEDAQSGRINCIIVKDLSRFGRNSIDSGYYIEKQLPAMGVRFIAVTDAFDSKDGDGGVMIPLKNMIAESYSKDLSRKISSAKREKARRGEAVTKNCAFGYMLDENRKMVIDLEAAETVRTIFEMYAGCKSIAGIEKRLYHEHRPTPAAWKKHRWKTAETEEFRCVWQKSVILSILYDEQYIGTYIAGKTRTTGVGNANRAANAKEDWIRIPNHHPAIISQELFDAVQEKLLVRGEPHRKRELGTAQRYAAVTSPLKGKVICGHCGHTMRLSQTKNAAFHCWFTRSAAAAGCHKLRVLGSEVEDVVRDIVLQQAALVLSRHDMRGTDSARCSSNGVAECDLRLSELQSKKQELYENLVLGAITPEGYKTQKAVIDIEMDRQQQVNDAIRIQNEKNAPSAASVQAARAALDAGMLSPELVDMLIERVLIFPGNRIEIVWKVSGFSYGMAGLGQTAFVAT